MSNLIPFGSYDEEAAKEEEEDLQKGGSADFFKPKEGRNILRFLPPRRGAKSPFVKVYQHYIKVPHQDRPVVFACPRYFNKPEPCIACAKAEQLHKSGKRADKNRASDIWPSRRVFANVINREEPEKGPLVYAFGKTVHEQLVDIRQDDGDFTNPYQGFDIKIRRSGTGKTDTKYKVTASRKATPLSEDEQEALAWFENQHDLTKFAKVMTQEEIRAALRGEDPDDVDDDEEEEGDFIDVESDAPGVGAGGGADDDIPF